MRKIEQPEPKQPERDGTGAQAAAGESTKLIYPKASVPVRKWCKQRGFEVALPAFEGDASQIRKTNQQHLASCDAVPGRICGRSGASAYWPLKIIHVPGAPFVKGLRGYLWSTSQSNERHRATKQMSIPRR